MKFGDRLRDTRKKRGMTQQELADKLDCAKSTISMYEMNKREPAFEVIEEIADILNISISQLMENTYSGTHPLPANAIPVGVLHPIPIVGTVKAGYGGTAYEGLDGYELADVRHPEDYFYLRVSGDSMEPQISAGDLALVRRQDDVESGEIAVVIINGDEGTIKKVIKKGGSIVLQPFNPVCPVSILSGQELADFHIVGKVIKTMRTW